MTQTKLSHQIARVTGEPLAMVDFSGFSVTPDDADLESEDVQRVIDCPFCARPVSCPEPTKDGAETMAECTRCDVYFAFHPDEIYTISVEKLVGCPAI